MPGHSRIYGNEQADMLARSAAEHEGAWNLRRDLQSCLSAAKSSVYLLWQSHWDNLHKCISTFRHLSYEKRFRQICSLSISKKIREDMIEVFNIINEFDIINQEELFEMNNASVTRDNSMISNVQKIKHNCS